MGTFTELDLRVVDREDHPEGKTGYFMVMEDFHYHGTFDYMVPAGTLTDLASIPRLMRWLFNRTGPSRKAAVMHDRMYGTKWRTRKECDAGFKEMLLARNVGGLTARTYYRGVRAGGWTRGNW